MVCRFMFFTPLLVISLFKMPPVIVLKRYLVFLSEEL